MIKIIFKKVPGWEIEWILAQSSPLYPLCYSIFAKGDNRRSIIYIKKKGNNKNISNYKKEVKEV